MTDKKIPTNEEILEELKKMSLEEFLKIKTSGKFKEAAEWIGWTKNYLKNLNQQGKIN